MSTFTPLSGEADINVADPSASIYEYTAYLASLSSERKLYLCQKHQELLLQSREQFGIGGA
jgi:hypothetical protein